MLTKLVCLGVLALVAAAQDIPAGIKYDLTGLTYPRVPQLAHVHGVIELQLTPSEIGHDIKLISGHAMLVKQASDNLAKWRTDQPVTVDYTFAFIDIPSIVVKVPRGDAFDRLLLRMFHLATYTEQLRCQDSSIVHVSEPRVVQRSPLKLEIEIIAATRCLQTETSLLASR